MADLSSEDAGNAQAGAQVGGTGVSASAEIRMDVQPWRDVNAEIKKTVDYIKRLKSDLPSVAGSIGRVSADGKGGLGSSGVRNGVMSALQQSADVSEALAGARGAYLSAGGGRGGIGAGVKAFGKGAFGKGALSGGGSPEAKLVAAGVDKALALAGAGVQMIDRRIDSGANYALSADRMSVLYQQMTGKSQTQVQNQFRQPLTNYRLGAGGINTLLGLQASTGINAAKQASSVEALRTISGYSMSAGDSANMLASLGRPETVNRMFMMTGQSLYGFGGKQNTGMGVVQNIVRSAGLTDKKLVDSAFQQGSVSRDRLRQMGVPEDMIDTVLQYAKQNVTFREKGGRGMYDPSKKEQRKKMGIEDNFATQSEETERIRGRRDENFYSRQADNYAKMEKATQKVIQALGAFEDKLSGIIGARASTRPFQKAAGGFLKSIGKIAGIAGAIGTGAAAIGLTPFTGGASLAIGGAVLGGIGSAIGGGGDGNPAANSSESSTAPVTTNSSKSNAPKKGTERTPEENDAYIAKWYKTFKKQHLNPKLAQGVLSMLRDFPSLYVDGGIRTVAAQKQLWEGRMKVGTAEEVATARKKGGEYRPIEYPDGSGVFWVMKNRGKNTVAPPGRSMHEIGLAVDFDTGSKHRGETQRIVGANAGRYGMTLTSSEYWHVELKDHAHTRKEFNKTDKGKIGQWGQAYNPDVNGTSYFDVNDLITPDSPAAVGGVVDPSGSGAVGSIGGVKSGATGGGAADMEVKASGGVGGSSLDMYAGMSISEVLKKRKSKLSSKIGAGKYGAAVMTPEIGSPSGGDAVYNHSPSNNSRMSNTAPVSHSGANIRGGDTFNIAPVINIASGSDVSSADVRRLAKEVAKVLEHEIQTSAMRRK